MLELFAPPSGTSSGQPANITAPTAAAPAQIILTTDRIGDCDDDGALAILCGAHLAGYAALKAVVVGNKSLASAQAAWQEVRYSLGASNMVAIGQYNGNVSIFSSAPSSWDPGIAAGSWGASPAAAPGSFSGHVAVCRQALASLVAANMQGTWVSIGGLSIEADVLASPADGISPLSGSALFAAAIGRVVVMGGNDVANPTYAAETNVAYDVPGARAFQAAMAALSPRVEVYWSPFQLGNAINSLPTVDATNPYSTAYTALEGSGNTRPSWDPTAALFAVLGDRDIFRTSVRRVVNVIGGDGKNSWANKPGYDSCLGLNPLLTATDVGRMVSAAMDAGKPAIRLIDILGLSPIFGISTRRLSTDYAGPVIRVRRDDGVEADISCNGEDLDTAALLAHTGSGSGFLTRWYVQAPGGLYFAQATAANQPRIVNAGVVNTFKSGGKPSPVWPTGSAHMMTLSVTLPANTNAFEMAAVVNTTSGNTRILSYISDGGSIDYNGPANFGFFTGANGGTGGIVRGPVTGNAILAQNTGLTPGPNLHMAWADSSNIYYAANSATSQSSGAVTGNLGTQGLMTIGNDPGNEYMIGAIGEVIFQVGQSSADRSAFLANQKAYWGTP